MEQTRVQQHVASVLPMGRGGAKCLRLNLPHLQHRCRALETQGSLVKAQLLQLPLEISLHHQDQKPRLDFPSPEAAVHMSVAGE